MTNSEAIKSMRNLDDLISITKSERESVRMAISALEENDKLKAEIERLKEELEQSVIQCAHGYDKRQNEIGETLIYCEYTDKWMNVTLGECLGNCEAEQSLKSLKSLNGKVEE